MSNYPPGMTPARHSIVDYHCKKCKEYWEVAGIKELGTFAPNREEDEICPKCGGWMEPA